MCCVIVLSHIQLSQLQADIIMLIKFSILYCVNENRQPWGLWIAINLVLLHFIHMGRLHVTIA